MPLSQGHDYLKSTMPLERLLGDLQTLGPPNKCGLGKGKWTSPWAPTPAPGLGAALGIAHS